MKKSVFLILLFLFIFVACGKKNAPVYEKEEEQTYYIIKNKYLI